MTRMRKICTQFSLLLILWLSQAACSDNLKVRHSTGGQSMALEIAGDYWYQSLGDKLVVIRKHGNGQVAKE